MMKLVFTGVLAIILLGLGGCASTSTSSSQTQASSASVDGARAARINVQLGVEYFKQGELEQALKKLERAIGQDPNLPSAHNALALLKQRLGQVEEAEKHFQRAIKLDSSYSEAQNNYGVFLYSQGRYREAETHFLEAVKNPLYGTPELAYENAAMAAQKQSELDKAEDYYLKALQIEPRLPKSLYRMAEINFNQGHYQQAHEYLQRYRAVARHTSQSLWLGIKIERELGNEDAVSSYALLLRQNFPDSQEAQLLRESMERQR
ncbi:type IV pilus biogenesis/stability protein PilW [Nitrosococcus halophilus Nc 4]|uniref:Type IV pilus biogenesis/stability protein PilW n=1 Tax=Nitrosococcus halophilus (strain Nc4) TaxID=472759 RepID=D5BZ52_NITHN|nr:type IV pilus biogenesis/stability protein PilW [Nitrosococcus halophilus]ADE14265.1 type IV pilus biogenesis/stability protein PilW [Nitrosococcus halophilus Nc 4]